MRPNRPTGADDRRLALAASAVLLVACLLPWYAWSGGLPSTPRRGWEGSGILLAVAAIAVLALLTLPAAIDDDADRDRIRSGVERPLAYAVLAGLALVGLLVWPIAWLDAPDGLLPHRAPGLWLGAVGTLLLAAVAVRSHRRLTRR